MKVLHVYRTYFPDPPGGLQEAIRQIALSTQSIPNETIENRIFSLSPMPIPVQVERAEGLVIRARSWVAPASCDLGFIDSFQQFSRQLEWADVIHYHFPWPFADILHFFARMKKKYNKPCVMTYHSDVVAKGWLGMLYQPLMKRMLNSMDAVIATSSAYIKSSPVLASSVSSECLHTIPLGIMASSYQQYQQDSVDVSLQQEFGVKAGEYFLFIGVLRAYKGLYFLLEAAKKVNFPIAIAGTGVEQGKLSTIAKQSSNIHLLGQVTNAEKMALINGCKALILPSHLRSEAFGVVLLEAAMCEKPMISCEIGTGTSFANLDKETGFVVPPKSPDALANAMKRLVQDNDLTKKMGKAARSRYQQLFSGEALGMAYANLYKKTLNDA
ncbi:MAG: glycosyltransferase [Cocleimonas sp.]|nr:glycosyltransferase [Cocleimonas sp.]